MNPNNNIFDAPARPTPKRTRKDIESDMRHASSMYQIARSRGRLDLMTSYSGDMDKCQAELDAIGDKKAGATKFSTKAARAYARAKGWTITNSERYDFRNGRWYDAVLRSDLDCVADGQRVLVQAAGVGERAAHRRDFDALGGVEKCQEIGARFEYWEFVRGRKEPVKVEVWA